MAAQLATHHIKMENALEMFVFGSTYENDMILIKAKDIIKKRGIFIMIMFVSYYVS